MTQLHERNGDLGLEVQNLREELATERRDRQPNKKSDPAVVQLLQSADVLNQLKGQRKKSRAELADVEVVLEIVRRSLTVE